MRTLSPRPQPQGARERAKREKRRRILAAARDVFLAKGYEGATTREIADRAAVGRGTIFLYARDKRELFLMLVNDDLDEVTQAGSDAVSPAQPLVDQLTSFFRPRYAFWAREPQLSRTAMQLMGGSYLADTAGDELARGIARRANSMTHIIRIMRRRAHPGISDKQLAAAGEVIFAVYVTQLRLWLNEPAPDVGEGTAHLRALLTVALSGIDSYLNARD